ncbi:MAG TPA: nucleotide sugar dehydrogenase [Candidatus Acidoferrales bacterium]|nr:nucleotide sugar dehydrogenase [Candidatus Acidoferrales bacterium]
MRISVFGLGYVGCVTAAALGQRGHSIVGVDVNEHKVRVINRGESPVVEKGLEDLIGSSVRRGRLYATADAAAAVAESDVSLVCVGTPSRPNGSFDYGHLLSAVWQIADGIKRKQTRHVVAVRSTVLPGTTETLVIPELEKISGKAAHEAFEVCVNPEFMREGSSLLDFEEPPFVIVGSDERDQAARSALAQIYDGIGPLIQTSIKTAEVLKYVCNAFHALKITFANEVGNFCKALDIDSHEVMEIFCRDKKLNLGPAYLKPGFAFGGSCLPKDLRAIVQECRRLNLSSPLLNAVLESNRLQIQRAVDLVLGFGKNKVGLVGLTFKAGTDDLRESPLVNLCETLMQKGIELRVYDPSLVLDRLVGANRLYIEEKIPHVRSVLCGSLEELLANAEVVVLGNHYDGVPRRLAALNGKVQVLDLVGVFGRRDRPLYYQGICW